MVTTFVDNLYLIGPEIQQINQVKQELVKKLKIKNIRLLTYYFKMRIDKNKNKKILIFSQRSYITKILIKININNCRSVLLLIASSLTFSEMKIPKDVLQY